MLPRNKLNEMATTKIWDETRSGEAQYQCKMEVIIVHKQVEQIINYLFIDTYKSWK